MSSAVFWNAGRGWGFVGSAGEGDGGCEGAEQATSLSPAPRTATHWWESSGVEARSLLKLYGIRFDILVTGRVGGQGWRGRGVMVTSLGG